MPTHDESPAADDRPAGQRPRSTLTEKALSLVIALGILLSGVALAGLMLTTDQNMVGLFVAAILIAMGVRQLVVVLRR